MSESSSPLAAASAPWAAAELPALLSTRARTQPPAQWVAPDRPGALSIAPGIPDPASLPYDELLEATRRVIAEQGRWALEYGGVQGYALLREQIAQRIDPQGLGYNAANVAICNGSYQAMQIICDTFLDIGDTVIVEAPTYGGALRLFRTFGARAESVAVDEHGLLPDDLAATLDRLAAEGRRPKLLYTIPTFSNPTGVTTTGERRRRIVEIAARHHLLIMEDDAYGQLRFEGAAEPSLLSLAGGDGVLRTGSFSKIIASGLRLGWIQGEKAYIDALMRMRFDSGTSPWSAHIVAAYVEAGHHEPHVEKLRAVYRGKRDAMLSALEECCSPYATWTRPDGGFFIWLTLPERVDAHALERATFDEGVQVVPGAGCFINGQGRNNLRLAFSYLDEAQLAEAIRRLGRALDRALR